MVIFEDGRIHNLMVENQSPSIYPSIHAFSSNMSNTTTIYFAFQKVFSPLEYF
jgi:hypothetical protein